MGDKGQHETGIEWTHIPGYRGATWNPVRGCFKVSPGCKNCYAETFAERWRGVPGHPYEQGFDLRLVPEKLGEPLRKTKPHAYFVNSMSDLFHADVGPEYVAACFGAMAASQRHLFMCLTKRADIMAETVKWMSVTAESDWLRDSRRPVSPMPIHLCMEHLGRRGPVSLPFQENVATTWPLPNVWLGVSVEDRKYGLPRIAVLRTIPAAVRFLSVEPLLEDLGDIDLTGIHWVIVGGESGHGARPFDLAWARRIQAQCKEQAVPFFFKQPGDDSVSSTGDWGVALRLRKKSPRADLPRDLDVREWPRCVAEKAVPSCA